MYCLLNGRGRVAVGERSLVFSGPAQDVDQRGERASGVYMILSYLTTPIPRHSVLNRNSSCRVERQHDLVFVEGSTTNVGSRLQGYVVVGPPTVPSMVRQSPQSPLVLLIVNSATHPGNRCDPYFPFDDPCYNRLYGRRS
jgi:hypothetical protein